MTTDEPELEVGFVTEEPVETDGEVRSSTLPAGQVARTMHRGSFDGLGESWGRLRTWTNDQGMTPGPVMWESYLTEPSPDMDPADLRTELTWPVTGGG